MDATELTERLKSDGVLIYTASPWIITVPAAAGKIMDELMEHSAEIFATSGGSFHPCPLCFDKASSDQDEKHIPWQKELYIAVDSEDPHPGLEILDLLLKMVPHRRLFDCALCLIGPLNETELSMLDEHRAWTEAIIESIYGLAMPVLFGSNLQGTFHTDCLLNHGWTMMNAYTPGNFRFPENQ